MSTELAIEIVWWNSHGRGNPNVMMTRSGTDWSSFRSREANVNNKLNAKEYSINRLMFIEHLHASLFFDVRYQFNPHILPHWITSSFVLTLENFNHVPMQLTDCSSLFSNWLLNISKGSGWFIPSEDVYPCNNPQEKWQSYQGLSFN